MQGGDAGAVLCEHLLLCAALPDLDLDEEVAVVHETRDVRGGYGVLREGDRGGLRVAGRERRAVLVRHHGVERRDSVFTRV